MVGGNCIRDDTFATVDLLDVACLFRDRELRSIPYRSNAWHMAASRKVCQIVPLIASHPGYHGLPLTV